MARPRHDIYTTAYILALFIQEGLDGESISRRLKTETQKEFIKGESGFWNHTDKDVPSHEPLDVHSVYTVINAYRVMALGEIKERKENE